ncbi:MAG: ISAs1 family transposase, partial [Stellaceae bacterium]
MSVTHLVEEFSTLKDPRRRGKIDGLGTCLALPHGIPAHDTFRGVFTRIDPGGFERGFAAWARLFGTPVEREVAAIDRKTIPGSWDRGREQGPLHVVSAWACDRRLVLGQCQDGDKSNGITAIPELLEVLDVEETIVTLEAIGCERAIARKTLEKGADDRVVLKANQGKKFTAVHELCAAGCFSRSPRQRPIHDKFEESHGRLVRRRVFVCPDARTREPLRDWPGPRAILAVESIRSINGSGKGETDIRCFLPSSADHPERLAQAVREHWQIENGLHWVLDVTFQKDQCRMRDRNA